MRFFKKYGWLFAILVALSALPWNSLHHLSEEHYSEVHDCHAEFCFSEAHPDCDICLFQIPEREFWKNQDASQFIQFPQKIYPALSTLISDVKSEPPRNKAPPLS